MINHYPWWKNALIAIVLVMGGIYAAPNLFGEDPALQISGTRMATVDETTLNTISVAVREAGMNLKDIRLTPIGVVARFDNTDDQLKAQDIVRSRLGNDYVVALNLAPATPEWLQGLGAKPMFLGLDLRGGVHFLMEVDMDAAVALANERYADHLRRLLRENKIRYRAVNKRAQGGIEMKFGSAEDRQSAQELIRKEFNELTFDDGETGAEVDFIARLTDEEEKNVKRFALQQNITTLRNRVNELGVAEPVIQQQGNNRIVVQLPGIQDTARAKDILSATATLEFHMVDESANAQDARAGRTPVGSQLYTERNGAPILLQKRIIVTGDQITDAQSGIDQTDGSAAVFLGLDGQGAKQMLNTTKENVGKLMAVVFIENKTDTKIVNGEAVKTKRRVEEVINTARIREPFGKRFQITGLDSTDEARNLSLLLRAGALSAPIDIVEERTVGPSLGKANIDQGFMSVQIGFALVLVFMAVYYRAFGLISGVALAVNVVLLVSLLSLIQATLTLPGIAGIVLTVGMAVDANVLIYERIREEIRNGNSPQASIHAGYEKAFSTIADSNITTLIATVVLFGFGAGPIKGFAVTLMLGICTSMFTAIVVTRAIVNFRYGGKRFEKLAI